jgi:hypothetical protein
LAAARRRVRICKGNYSLLSPPRGFLSPSTYKCENILQDTKKSAIFRIFQNFIACGRCFKNKGARQEREKERLQFFEGVLYSTCGIEWHIMRQLS